jgi:hypothetical protein
LLDEEIGIRSAMENFYDIFSMVVIPVLSLFLTGYTALLSNPKAVNEHLSATRKFFVSFVKTAAPYICIAALAYTLWAMPDPASKSWLLAVVVSSLATCSSFAIAWVNHMKAKIEETSNLQSEHIGISNDMLEMYTRTSDLNAKYFRAFVSLHQSTFETFGLIFPELEKSTGWKARVVSEHLKALNDKITSIAREIEDAKENR